MNSEILTEKEVCQLLTIKPRTLRLWRRERGIPYLKITSREIRYRSSDIDRWLDARRTAVNA